MSKKEHTTPTPPGTTSEEAPHTLNGQAHGPIPDALPSEAAKGDGSSNDEIRAALEKIANRLLILEGVVVSYLGACDRTSTDKGLAVELLQRLNDKDC